jgi:hypothetical protein
VSYQRTKRRARPFSEVEVKVYELRSAVALGGRCELGGLVVARMSYAAEDVSRQERCNRNVENKG